jgi:deoxyribodipyrimidine photo-lyase
MSHLPVVHWFRRDLRLSDNTALRAALKTGQPVIPLYIIDPALTRGVRFSASRMAFILENLCALDDALKGYGTRLLVRHGKPENALPQVIRETNTSALYANRDYTPYAIQRDHEITDLLEIPVHWYDDLLLHAPGQHLLTATNKPYTVFTPFKKKWLDLPKPSADGGVIREKEFHMLDGVANDGIPTLKTLDVTDQIVDLPPAGESHARRRLKDFAGSAIFQYADGRNRLIANPFDDPAPRGTSYLSPYLRFGVLSPRQAYAAAHDALKSAEDADDRRSVETWISELVWRDFYYHILTYFPHVHDRSFQEAYEAVSFRNAPDELQRWKEGQTGYPVVDAAMRQMNTIGWMHNRARMIVASFLTKDLLIYWREGEQYFMQKLLDGDIAANNGGWQWAAGTGTDAQPYFRIFNPVSQSRQYDPNGDYIRHFVPELRALSDHDIHEPWKMSSPPKQYPPPIVDHGMARARTLEAFKAARKEIST